MGDEAQPEAAGAANHQELLGRLSRETALIQKDAFGKGPVAVRSYLFDDLLLVVMRDGLTVAEKTMLEFGQGDLVRQFRQTFENEMTSRFVDMVEAVTARKVLTYQSQIMFNPDVVIEIFVFDRELDGEFVSAEITSEDDAPA
jgi:uncharacterized protein YbcI